MARGRSGGSIPSASRHGGLFGLRDDNALESALAHPRHRWAHEEAADLASLGAACAFALARNHPYNDGNTRVALLAMLTFLALNGEDVAADDEDLLATIVALAAGRLTEGELTLWVRAHLASAK